MGERQLIEMAAVRRANKEFKNVASACAVTAEAQFGDGGENAMKWNVMLQGPAESPFEGAVLQLEVNFPADYPFKPPKVVFAVPKAVYHPNVNEDGTICLDILKTKYSPACSMPQVFEAIRSLLQFPSTDAPLRADVGRQYDEDREAYNANAKAAWEN